MEPLISVIIPCHKVDDYVDKCIQSVLSQTEKRVEILIAFDPKNQDGLKIMQEKYSSTCRVIPAPGNSAAPRRNLGLDLAKGKYVFFMDADDFLTRNDVFSVMLECIENNDVDMVRGDYESFDGDKFYGGRTLADLKEDRILSGLEPLKDYFDHELQWGVVWNVLFKRDFIGENRFEESYRIAEDCFFTFSFLTRQPKVYQKANFISYAYRANPQSATHNLSLDIHEANFLDQEKREKIIKENFPQFNEDMRQRLIKEMQRSFAGLAVIGSKEAKDVYKNKRKKYLSLGKVSPKRRFTKKERILDSLIRMNLFWPVYRLTHRSKGK